MSAPRSLPVELAVESGDFMRHAARVSALRTLRGPQRPRWDLRYEIVMSFMRTRFRDASVPVAEVRRRLDALGGLERRRRDASMEPVVVGGVPCTWVVHPSAGEDVLVYLHGGGYGFGSTLSHAHLLKALSKRSRRRVLSIDYRLAPEHPCPAAIEDAVAVWRALCEDGIAMDRTALAGDSAGGGLALTMLLALRDADLPPPQRAVLLSPWTDLGVTGQTPGMNQHDDYLGTPEGLHLFGGYYSGSLSRTDPRVSPLYAPDLSGLPPLFLLAGGAEMILDDSTRMVTRLRDAGVQTALHVEPDEVHVYPVFADLSARGRNGLARMARFLDDGVALAGSSRIRGAGSS